MKKSGGEFLEFGINNGEIVPFKDFNISIATLALHYGLAAFGGLRALPTDAGKIMIFRLDRHVKRLAASARVLMADITEEQIEQSIKKLVSISPTQESYYIRPLIFNSSIGLAPRLHDSEWSLALYGVTLGDYLPKDGVRCCFSSWTRQGDNMIPGRGKISGSYITSAMAKTEACKRGFEESILLNAQGKISEASAMNLFIVREGELITPRITDDILEGITRSSVIEIAKSLKIPVIERQVDKSELLIADEIFLTGSAARITPVLAIESWTMKTDRPVTKLLIDKFNNISFGKDPEYSKWITVLDGKNSK